jgi:hypothetical protein
LLPFTASPPSRRTVGVRPHPSCATEERGSRVWGAVSHHLTPSHACAPQAALPHAPPVAAAQPSWPPPWSVRYSGGGEAHVQHAGDARDGGGAATHQAAHRPQARGTAQHSIGGVLHRTQRSLPQHHLPARKRTSGHQPAASLRPKPPHLHPRCVLHAMGVVAPGDGSVRSVSSSPACRGWSVTRAARWAVNAPTAAVQCCDGADRRPGCTSCVCLDATRRAALLQSSGASACQRGVAAIALEAAGRGG